MGENMNKWKKWFHTAKQRSQGRVTWLVTKDSHKEGSGGIQWREPSRTSSPLACGHPKRPVLDYPRFSSLSYPFSGQSWKSKERTWEEFVLFSATSALLLLGVKAEPKIIVTRVAPQKLHTWQELFLGWITGYHLWAMPMIGRQEEWAETELLTRGIEVWVTKDWILHWPVPTPEQNSTCVTC